MKRTRVFSALALEVSGVWKRCPEAGNGNEKQQCWNTKGLNLRSHVRDCDADVFLVFDFGLAVRRARSGIDFGDKGPREWYDFVGEGT